MKITTMAAITALAPASPVMAQQEHPMSPGDSGAANQHIGLAGYNPYGPRCSPQMKDISHDEAAHEQWSFFVCRNGTIDCQLSQHVYIGELAATYPAASQPHGFYATNIASLRLLLGMMQAPGTAGKAIRAHPMK